MSQADGAAVPADQKGGWFSFLKSIASFSGDLSKMTAPSFILSPVSLTEYPSYWGEHPEHFAMIKHVGSPEARMVAVLRWFIATLKGQYTSRNTSMGSEKKPLNPILGELFLGTWPKTDKRGTTSLVSEQVSHHPPITAYHLDNPDAGVSVEGHSGQKTSFNGRSIQVVQVGHAMLRVKLDEGGEETYLITLPTLHIDGLWYGSPYIELANTSYIHSTTGLTATINYAGKGYFSGKPHSFTANITKDSNPSEVLLDIAGSWTGVSNVRGGSLLPTDSVFWDANAIPREELSVKPLEEQGALESRKVWQSVAEGIRTGNYNQVSREKSNIENRQRQLRKERAEQGTEHQLQYFDCIDNDSEYAQLAKPLKNIPDQSHSYRFKRDKEPPRDAPAGDKQQASDK